MNWWPWQTKQVPARTAGSTAPTLPLGGAHHSDLLSSPIEDMTLLAARGNAAWRNAMNKAQAERQRKPEPAAIDWYRQRTRTAELRAEKFGMALAEIIQLAGRRGPHNEIGALNQIEATAKGALKTP